jgi:hypothetical protein
MNFILLILFLTKAQQKVEGAMKMRNEATQMKMEAEALHRATTQQSIDIETQCAHVCFLFPFEVSLTNKFVIKSYYEKSCEL